MERRGPTPGSGMYGQACVQCSRAKSKCIARPNATGCERCFRLRKQCQAPDHLRRRPVRRGSGSQISKLEGSIATLTAMLESVTSGSSMADLLGSTATTGISATPSLTASHTSPDELYTVSSGLSPPTDDVDACIDRFRRYMLPCFPFMTVSEQWEQRPLLLQSIVAAASRSAAQKQARFERLKRRLTELVVFQNESSIDLLLSTLTYITWSADPFMKKVNDLPRMMMMAMTLVYDLQLSKTAPPEASVIAAMAPGLGVHDVPGDGHAEGSLERQRALLAFFVLSSIVSASFGRLVAPQWLPQMEEALSAVENSKCPSDESFAVHVRLQLIAQRALSVRDSEGEMSAEAAASMYIKVLQSQLDDLKVSMASNLPRIGMITANAHYVELCISESTRLATLQTPLETTSMEQIESMWKNLHAVKSWFDAFYTIPPAEYVGFPFFVWFQLVRCVVIAKHLSTFEDPAWDAQTARETVDVLAMMDWLAEKAEQASREAGEQSDDHVFSHVSRMMRQSQKWVAMKRSAAQTAGGSAHDMDISPVEGMDADMSWIVALQSGDENWLEEVLGWSPAVV